MTIYAVQSYIIAWDTIAEIAPEEAQALLNALNGKSIDAFCQHFDDWDEILPEDDDGEWFTRIQEAWNALANAVKHNTVVNGDDGLVVGTGYYNADVAECPFYFEESQGYFYVDNAVTFTPAAQKYGDRIQKVLWVESE